MFAWRDNYISYNGEGGGNTDPFWSSVTFLQNYEYPAPSPVYDLSTNNLQPMVTGAARPSTRTPFTGVGGSYKFDTSTAAQLIFPQNAGMSVGTNNFTVECWVYINAFPGNNVECVAIATNQSTVGQATARIVVTPAGAVFFLCNNAAGSGWINNSTTATGTVGLNTWYHLAGVRNGTNFTLYVNGVSRLTYTSSSAVGYLSAGNATHIGNLPVGTGFTGANNAFITNVRFVNGTAVYTSAFTPPTSPLTAITNTQLLVTFPNSYQSNYSIPVDYSFNSWPITRTGNSVTSTASPFSGYYGSYKLTTGYMLVTTQTALALSTTNFSIEGWFRLTTTGVIQYILDQRNNATATITPTIYVNASNVLIYYSNGSDRITGTTTLSANVWYNFTVNRTSNSTKLYLNGTQEGSTYSDANTYVTARIALGTNGSSAGNNNLVGQLSNIRITKGVGLYPNNFTPSTTPLTTTTDTLFLLSGTYFGLYDLSNSNQGIFTPTFTGSLTSTQGGTTSTAITSPLRYKWGTQSMYYQRQSSTQSGYQTVLDSTSLQFGTGDFTIEGWIFAPSAVGTLTLGIMAKGTSSTGWYLQLNSSNILQWFSGVSILRSSTTQVFQSTWTYFAITRSGTTGRMFINGTQEGASFTDSTNYNQTNDMFIGCDRNNQSGFIGYMDDIRITKGVARYTANFTPPSGPFPTS